jgi:hypothetical protein
MSRCGGSGARKKRKKKSVPEAWRASREVGALERDPEAGGMSHEEWAAYLRLVSPEFEPAPLPDAPTEALPGTEEKLLVMRARFRKRQEVFHPQDHRPSRGDGDGEGEEEA